MSGFDAGLKHVRAVECWRPSVRSADEDIIKDKPSIEGRAHDLSRNNGTVRGAIETKKNRVVGSYFKLQLRPIVEMLPDSIKQEDVYRWASIVEKAFHLYADDHNCYIDARRQSTFTQLLRECVGMDMLHGEHFLSREYKENQTGTGICFLSIEPNRVTNPIFTTNENIAGGVYLDALGEAKAYSIAKRKTGVNNYLLSEFQKINKYDKNGWLNIIHTFERERPNQTRGFSRFASVISAVKQLDRLKAAQLESALLSTMYTMYIKSDLTSEIFDALSSVDGNPLSNLAKLNQEFHTKNQTNLVADGVKVPHLAPNESLEMVGTNNQAGAFDVMERTHNREVARGFGMSYEETTGDFTNTTYSSARMSQALSWEEVKSQREGTIVKTANHMFTLWLDEQIVKGRITTPGGIDYFKFKPALTSTEWIGAGRIIVDEVKHAAALEKLMNIGVVTLQEACAEHGRDWESVLMQQKIEQMKREELQLHTIESQTTINFTNE